MIVKFSKKYIRHNILDKCNLLYRIKNHFLLLFKIIIVISLKKKIPIIIIVQISYMI